jgi:hypothetical protein
MRLLTPSLTDGCDELGVCIMAQRKVQGQLVQAALEQHLKLHSSSSSSNTVDSLDRCWGVKWYRYLNIRQSITSLSTSK